MISSQDGIGFFHSIVILLAHFQSVIQKQQGYKLEKTGVVLVIERAETIRRITPEAQLSEIQS